MIVDPVRLGLTAAGTELVHEGERLLAELDTVAQRIRRVATGWEAVLNIAVDSIITEATILDLIAEFLAQRPPTRIKLQRETLSGTWEAAGQWAGGPRNWCCGPTGHRRLAFRVPHWEKYRLFLSSAPNHPLASVAGPITDELLMPHRMVALADSAQQLAPMTVGLLPGQDVLTVPSMALKIAAQVRGLGCGYLPEPLIRAELASGRLIEKARIPCSAASHVVLCLARGWSGARPGATVVVGAFGQSAHTSGTHRCGLTLVNENYS